MDAVRPLTADFEALVDHHQAAVWRYLRVLGCDPAEAEELTQEAFVRLLDGPFEVRSARSTRRYLRNAARFLFLQARERQARRVEVAWTDAVDTWFGEQCERDDGDAWLAALQHCTDGVRGRARDVLEAFYGEGLSRGEIAQRLGMKENGVKTVLQRLRAQLRACIERELKR